MRLSTPSGAHAIRRLVSGPATTGRRTTNSLPLPSPSLCAVTVPPCISTSERTSVSPTPSPPSARSRVRRDCTNSSNTESSISRGMPAPSSRTRMTAASPSPSARERHVPAARRVLRGVAQQVDLDLLQARRVAVTQSGADVELDRESEARGFHGRADRIRGLLHDRHEVDDALPQLDLVLRHAARLEQVVEQARHLLRLALEDLTRACDGSGSRDGRSP